MPFENLKIRTHSTKAYFRWRYQKNGSLKLFFPAEKLKGATGLESTDDVCFGVDTEAGLLEIYKQTDAKQDSRTIRDEGKGTSVSVLLPPNDIMQKVFPEEAVEGEELVRTVHTMIVVETEDNRIVVKGWEDGH